VRGKTLSVIPALPYAYSDQELSFSSSERKRLETIAQNQKLLESLNLPKAVAQTAVRRVQRSSSVASSDSKPKPKKKRPSATPTRDEALLRPRRESKRLKKLDADGEDAQKIKEVRSCSFVLMPVFGWFTFFLTL
jgi:hypothetical protein